MLITMYRKGRKEVISSIENDRREKKPNGVFSTASEGVALLGEELPDFIQEDRELFLDDPPSAPCVPDIGEQRPRFRLHRASPGID